MNSAEVMLRRCWRTFRSQRAWAHSWFWPTPDSVAGAYRISSRCALVQTADFFTPIVDEPFAYGQIAAANALSDVYAMGARPITALNIVAMPTDRLDGRVIREILRGGASKVKEA